MGEQRNSSAIIAQDTDGGNWSTSMAQRAALVCLLTFEQIAPSGNIKGAA